MEEYAKEKKEKVSKSNKGNLLPSCGETPRELGKDLLYCVVLRLKYNLSVGNHSLVHYSKANEKLISFVILSFLLFL